MTKQKKKKFKNTCVSRISKQKNLRKQLSVTVIQRQTIVALSSLLEILIRTTKIFAVRFYALIGIL